MKKLSKKVLVLTVTLAFQNMPKSGLKITSPRYLLLKDLAEAAELSVSTELEDIVNKCRPFGYKSKSTYVHDCVKAIAWCYTKKVDSKKRKMV